MPMFVTIINDCHCPNARGRQETRVASIFNCPVNFIKINSDLEAAGNLVDALEAGLGREGVILLNVAPRNGQAKKWKNGTPFGYFYFRQTLVISTLDGQSLSLLKKSDLFPEIKMVDLEKTVKLNFSAPEKIIQTQFRSLEFSPRLASWIMEGKKIKSEPWNISQAPDIEALVWCVDNFGNLKTSVIAGTAEAEKIKSRLTKQGFKFVTNLKNCPDKQTCLIKGSSGWGEKKFLEIVINGGNAAQELGLGIGSDLNKI